MSLANRYVIVTPTAARPWFLLVDSANEILGRFEEFAEAWAVAVALANVDRVLDEGPPR